MSEVNRVLVSNDLGEFFRQEVGSARAGLGIKMPHMTEFYLVNLLCDFARPDKAPAGQPGLEPLAFMYKRAHEASAAEQVQLYKNLGDMSLYIAGFFTDFVEKSMVDVDYYVAMGGNAYSSLSGLVGSRRQGATFGRLYGQLSHDFVELVDVLNEVADRSREKGSRDIDLLKVYDRWLRTGSRRLRLKACRGRQADRTKPF